MKGRSIRSLGTIGGLRRGITTGTCAQAAAKAAAELLSSTKTRKEVDIELPRGLILRLPLVDHVLEMRGDKKVARCIVIKDAGDDEDVTDGARIACEVSEIETPEIIIRGGKGVGTVTKPGLPVAVGESAINPVPKKMIVKELKPLMPHGKGLEVVVEVENGEELARSTWNPKVGIVGGISIIGTSGIVEPKSAAAFKSSIAMVIKVALADNCRLVCITPGYVGERFLRGTLQVQDEAIIKVGDHVGFALKHCAKRAGTFEECLPVLFAGHISKMAKVAAGMFNTHSKYGDARLEVIAACAGAAGASPEVIRELLSQQLSEAAIDIVRREGLDDTFDIIARRVVDRCLDHVEHRLKLAVALLSLDGEILSSIPENLEEKDVWQKFSL